VKIVEAIELFYLHFAVKIYELVQQRRVAKRFYQDPIFKACDKALRQGPSPYRIKAAFPYGETPLCSLKQIADRFGLGPSDCVVDLGCGRGRAVFFLSQLYGCKAHGIDLIAPFIDKATAIATHHLLSNVSFSCGDLRLYDFSKATFVFFYGTTFPEAFLNDLSVALESLPQGGKIVSVSAPLPNYPVVDQCVVSFPWGRGEIFLQIK
jgi:SAM-dependent methyltransferase